MYDVGKRSSFVLVHGDTPWWCGLVSSESGQSRKTGLSVYFVKWSCVGEARVPNLVDDLGGLYVILAAGPRHDGLDSPLADAVLELLRQCPVPASKSLTSPSTFTAEHGGSDLNKSGKNDKCQQGRVPSRFGLDWAGRMWWVC